MNLPPIRHFVKLSKDKNVDYRSTLYADTEGLRPEFTDSATLQGTPETRCAIGLRIQNDDPGASALLADGAEYALESCEIKLLTNGDGKDACDFVGLGSAVAAFNGAELTLTDCDIATTGVAKCALFCDGGDIVAKNCRMSVPGGTLYEGYINSADMNLMVAPPWVLGIHGTARGINLLGKKASVALVDSEMTVTNWGALSTDNGADNLLTVADTSLTLTGTEKDRQNPFFKTYGSGYGTYILGCHEELRGVEMNVGTYIGIARDGSAVYGSSKGMIRHVSPRTGKVLYEQLGKGRISVLNSDGFGIMNHGWTDLTFTEGTELNCVDAAFLCRAGGVKIRVEDGAKIRAEKGVLVQLIDDDDALVGVDWDNHDIELAFLTEFNEKEGWPSENGQITSLMPPAPPPPPPPEDDEDEDDMPMPPPQFDVRFTAENTDLRGNLFNGSGYYGQSAKQLYVELNTGAALTGTVSATETIHINENGEQNTHFTAEEYYYLGHVKNRPFYNGDNATEVRLNAGSRWTVTAEGILTAFTQMPGAEFVGRLRTDEGELTPELGKTYTGKLSVLPL